MVAGLNRPFNFGVLCKNTKTASGRQEAHELFLPFPQIPDGGAQARTTAGETPASCSQHTLLFLDVAARLRVSPETPSARASHGLPDFKELAEANEHRGNAPGTVPLVSLGSVDALPQSRVSPRAAAGFGSPGMPMPSRRKRRRMRLRNSCRTRYWSRNSPTWQTRVKPRPAAPKPGSKRA